MQWMKKYCDSVNGDIELLCQLPEIEDLSPPSASMAATRHLKQILCHQNVLWKIAPFEPAEGGAVAAVIPLQAGGSHWAELLPELLELVCSKLAPSEILLGGVGQVCRHWRHVVSSLRFDWTCILLLVWDDGDAATANHMARMVLRRGGARVEELVVPFLDNTTLPLVAQRGNSLRVLRMWHSTVTDAELAAAAASFPNLIALDIWECSSIGAGALEAIGNSCGASLEKLQCGMLGDGEPMDEAVRAIVRTMPALRRLGIFGVNVQQSTILLILDEWRSLVQLDLRGCNVVTVDFLLYVDEMYLVLFSDYSDTENEGAVEDFYENGSDDY